MGQGFSIKKPPAILVYLNLLCTQAKYVGVLDIDSPIKERFDEEDRKGLQRLVEILENSCDF